MSVNYLLKGNHDVLTNAVDEPGLAGGEIRVIVPQKVVGDTKFRGWLDHVTYSASATGRVRIFIRKAGGGPFVKDLFVGYTDDFALDFRSWGMSNDEEMCLEQAAAADVGWSVVYHYE